MPIPFHPWRVRFALALAAGLVACSLAAALAHGWEELDPQRALAESDAVLRVATAVQEGWLRDGDGTLPAADAAWPAELLWWRWFETRLAEAGNAGVVASIEEHAPAWLAEAPERDAVAWWFDALAEIVAHAAARTVDAAARVEAAAVLGRPAVVPVEAELASWLVVLPVLSDAEHRALAPVFARLDALVTAVLP
jgi:hypothetical protein